MKVIADFFGAEYESVVACTSHYLIRPADEVRRLAAPFLRFLHGADLSLGVHIRTGDATMIKHQGYHGVRRKLALEMKRAFGISEQEIATRISARAAALQLHSPNPRSVAVFVGTTPNGCVRLAGARKRDSSEELRQTVRGALQ